MAVVDEENFLVLLSAPSRHCQAVYSLELGNHCRPTGFKYSLPGETNFTPITPKKSSGTFAAPQGRERGYHTTELYMCKNIFRTTGIQRQIQDDREWKAATTAQMGVNDIVDWHQNIDGGVKYFAQLLKRFNGNYNVAPAAYNAGPNNPGVQ